ncbi:hypothetical protein JXO52_10430 [bacterium]|nr:hypothetical protein [bacterium]
MSYTSWLEHRGKKILFVDYRGQKTPEGMIQVLEEEISIEIASPTKVLVLANFEGTSGSVDYMTRLKKAGKEIRNEKVQKTALLGITGLKIILLDGYIRFTGDKHIRPFDTEASALNWLVE